MRLAKLNIIFVIIILLSGLLAPVARAQDLVISKVSVKAKGQILPEAAMVISWYTSVVSVGRIDYGLTENYGAYLASSKATDTYHEIELANLKSETVYHYKITANTADGLLAESFDQTFKTPKYTDNIAPELSEVKVTYSGATYFILTWKTNKAIDGDAEYSTDNTFKRYSRASGGGKVFTHEAVAKGLKNNSLYYYRIKSRNSDRKEWINVDNSVTTAPDASGDKENLVLNLISPVSIYDPVVTSNSVTVTWHSSRPSRGNVEYWADQRYARRTKINETGFYGLDHSLTLVDLKAGTRYKFKINSTDVLGKSTKTEEAVFVTKLLNGEVPPVQSGCSSSGIYGGACRNLNSEKNLAVNLRAFLNNIFSGKVPLSAYTNWFTLVKAYVYGGYPPEAIIQAVKFGGKTVHPTIPWSKWKESEDYQNYINR